jgi:hypothetical protein
MRFTISETTETASHKATNHRARKVWRESNPAATRYNGVPTEFVAVDGEGQNFPSGRNGWVLLDEHRYVLLSVGDQHITNENGLSFEECFEFLWSQFRTGSVAYVGFFLAYDFIQMLKKLPEERARMLLTKEGIAKRKRKTSKRPHPFPVRYKGWEFDILGTKRLMLRPEGESRWMNICDTGGFFQKSFMKVIDPKEWNEPIVKQDEYEILRAGKLRRNSAILDSDMLAYNRLENEVLSRVLLRLNQGFQSLGIHLRPSQWFGPGQAAQCWLTGHDVITAETLQAITAPEVLAAAQASYFGGWFEIMAHGIIPGTTYEYDINSAYPYFISTLPCLEHGSWQHRKSFYKATFKEIASTPYSLVYARVWGTRNKYIGSMQHRQENGTILRPYDTEGWYWLHELEASERAGLVKNYTIKESWTYTPCECEPPLREIRDIYNLRKQVGKKTPLGIACKLVPNSLYGKFAQSVGNPKFGNAIYASLVTAGCRTMILNAIATHPKGYKSCVMVATDGVYFQAPHPYLPLSGELGDWDYEEKEDLCLFKPGVYWDNKAREAFRAGKDPIFKTRGINARDFAKEIATVDADFWGMREGIPVNKVRYPYGLPGEYDHWPRVTFPISFQMITAVQALMRNNWALAGTITPDAWATQSADPFKKRELQPRAEAWATGIERTVPYEYGESADYMVPSTPYSKRFGVELEERLLQIETINQDGDASSLVSEALYARGNDT